MSVCPLNTQLMDICMEIYRGCLAQELNLVDAQPGLFVHLK